MPLHNFCGLLFYQMYFVRPKKSPATCTCSRVLSTNIKNFFVQYPYHAVIGGNLKAIPNSPFPIVNGLTLTLSTVLTKWRCASDMYWKACIQLANNRYPTSYHVTNPWINLFIANLIPIVLWVQMGLKTQCYTVPYLTLSLSLRLQRYVNTFNTML